MGEGLRRCPTGWGGIAARLMSRKVGQIHRRRRNGRLRQESVNLASVVSVVQKQMGQDQTDGHLLGPSVHALVVKQIFQGARRDQLVCYPLDPLVLFETRQAKRVEGGADFMIE